MSAARFLTRFSITSSVSAITISDIFTQDFRWYLINGTGRNVASGTPNMDIKLTYNGAASDHNTYQMSGTDLNAHATFSDVNFSDTERMPNVVRMNTEADGYGFQMYICNPAHPANTIAWMESAMQMNANNQFRSRFNSYAVEDTALYDGLTFFNSTGVNFDSGGWLTIDIYGLQS